MWENPGVSRVLPLYQWFNGWVKVADTVLVSMATWTTEYDLKIPLFSSLPKIRSLDFSINLHIAYYN